LWLLLLLLPEEVTEDGDNGAVEDNVGMLVLLTPAGTAFGGLGGKLLLLLLMVAILNKRDLLGGLILSLDVEKLIRFVVGMYSRIMAFMVKSWKPTKTLLSYSLLRHTS
jgi:hypothetical protein